MEEKMRIAQYTLRPSTPWPRNKFRFICLPPVKTATVLLLISAEKAADGQQHKRCSSEIIDRQCNAPRAFRNQLPDGCRIQQNVNQKLLTAHNEWAENGGADGHPRNTQRQFRRILCTAYLTSNRHKTAEID